MTPSNGTVFRYRTYHSTFGNGLPGSICERVEYFRFVEEGESWADWGECYADTEEELFAFIEKWAI